MTAIDIISTGYNKLFGGSDISITALPQSGSDRRYFRISDGSKSVIGAYNANLEENEAFIGFTAHFISKGLPVPEIFGYVPDQFIYFLQDLGDIPGPRCAVLAEPQVIEHPHVPFRPRGAGVLV